MDSQQYAREMSSATKFSTSMVGLEHGPTWDQALDGHECTNPLSWHSLIIFHIKSKAITYSIILYIQFKDEMNQTRGSKVTPSSSHHPKSPISLRESGNSA